MGSAMRVLLVDDDALNRSVLKAMLDVVGAEVTEAEDGPAGVAEAAAQRFDVVLMDLRMPGMDGLAALREIIGRSGGLPAPPVVIVTADSAGDLRSRCLAAGASGFLAKPIAMDELFDVIAQVAAQGPGASV